jgi:hypothetical protein
VKFLKHPASLQIPHEQLAPIRGGQKTVRNEANRVDGLHVTAENCHGRPSLNMIFRSHVAGQWRELPWIPFSRFANDIYR